MWRLNCDHIKQLSLYNTGFGDPKMLPDPPVEIHCAELFVFKVWKYCQSKIDPPPSKKPLETILTNVTAS